MEEPETAMEAPAAAEEAEKEATAAQAEEMAVQVAMAITKAERARGAAHVHLVTLLFPCTRAEEAGALVLTVRLLQASDTTEEETAVTNRAVMAVMATQAQSIRAAVEAARVTITAVPVVRALC